LEVSSHPKVTPALLKGKEPMIPIDKEGGWTPELVWTLWRRKKETSTAPAGIQTVIMQTVA
jgi:hypothetical protein